MRLLDIERQGKWVEQCEVTVRSVGVAYQNPDDGSWCQTIEITDPVGREDVLQYYFRDDLCKDDNPMGMVEPSETGQQWYRIKWTGSYFKAKPAKAKPKESLNAEARQPPNWQEINLGKCRHGIVCSYIKKNGLPEVTDYKAWGETINKLAEFSMTGEIK